MSTTERLRTKTETYKVPKLIRTLTLILRIDQLLSAVCLVPSSMLPDGLGLTLSSLHRQDKGNLEK